MSSQLQLGPAREFERDRILDLWADQFGTYGHEDDLVDDALDDGTWRYAYTIGNKDDLYAFSLLTTVSIEDVSSHYEQADTSNWPKATKNGCVYMLCVADHAKNHGYGKTLLRRSHEWFWLNDIKRVYTTSWHRENEIDSRPLFESVGYEQLETVDEYYTADDGPQRNCPDCGVGCTCTASHWTIALEETDVNLS